MRFYQKLVCAVAVVAGSAAIPAHADVLQDLFTFNVNGTTGTGTATLASSPIPSSFVAGTSFTLSNVSTTFLGSTFTGDVTFYSAGGLSGGGAAAQLTTPVLFSGPVSSPTFLLGNFPVSGTLDLGNGPLTVTGVLAITRVNAAPSVPEPATFGLVGTAALGLVQLARRRPV
ncbi:MAG: PEP-CTERM sorting domain-containing protein [Acidobacteriota bacterium]|nr:PEP-CTERM sorting domain-containing protein [Acidobacteriota bacterium]